MQLTMSWAWLALECSYAFGQEFPRMPAGEPARFGSAFHELIARSLKTGQTPSRKWVPAVAKKWGVSQHEDEVYNLVDASREVLLPWLAGKNPFRINFAPYMKDALVEEAVALTPGNAGRFIEPHDEDHKYHGLHEGEIPGTLDLGVVPPRRKKLPILVEDHKTGEEDFSRPLDKPQLLAQAAATMRAAGRDEAIVAVLHARRWGMPKVYADKVKLSELKNFENRLAVAQARIGDGSMRPHAKCGYCPAREICPARDSELLARAGDVLTGLTAAGGALSDGGVKGTDLAIRTKAVMSVEKKMGLLYSVVKKAEVMAGRARDEIKKAILASGGRLLPETPEGEVLIVREYEKESVSKSSIVEALGKKAGEREIEKLRKAGAVRKTSVQALYPEKERGRGG